MFIILVIIAISAPLLANYEEDAITQNMRGRLMRPCREHIFGTDQYGRDMFARTIYGARVSLVVGIFSIAIALTLGTIIGSIAAYYGGKFDNILMRVMDIFLAIPHMLMAISIVAALGPGLINLLIAMSISSMPRFARVVRSAILPIKNQEFIEAARACGTKDSRIILKHIIPNAIGPIIVQATFNIAGMIISVAGLSFLGLGIKPPMPEWGSMLAEGKEHMLYYPHLVMVPGLAIVFAVVALNLMGDGFRDALDPRLKN